VRPLLLSAMSGARPPRSMPEAGNGNANSCIYGASFDTPGGPNPGARIVAIGPPIAERPVQRYGPRVLRRVISVVALLVLASAPMAARTRLFCRYTGLEITDCTQQEIPGSTVVQVAGCCDRQVTRPLGVVRIAQQQQIAPLALTSLAAPASFGVAGRPPPVHRMRVAAFPIGPPLFLVTRALLI
jgi:hypothetical protein